MSGHLHGGHAGLQLHAPFGGRVVNLPAGLRWNDFQKYYRGHPNGSTAERWQEYQQRERQRAEHPLRVTLPGPPADLPRCRPFPLSASACLAGWLYGVDAALVPCRAVLCRAVPCCAVLCRAVLCRAATAADPPPVLAVLAPAAVHAAKAAAQKAAAEARPEGGAEKRNAVWVAPRPITPTKRLVTDVADRLWDRKQSSDYRQWTRPDPAQKRQRSAGQMVLER
jgi:hypothetical protein